MSEILRVKINGNWVSIPSIKGDPGARGDKGDSGIIVSDTKPENHGETRLWVNPNGTATQGAVIDDENISTETTWSSEKISHNPVFTGTFRIGSHSSDDGANSFATGYDADDALSIAFWEEGDLIIGVFVDGSQEVKSDWLNKEYEFEIDYWDEEAQESVSIGTTTLFLTDEQVRQYEENAFGYLARYISGVDITQSQITIPETGKIIDRSACGCMAIILSSGFSSNIASGYCSAAFGYNTRAIGGQSFTEGSDTEAQGFQSHAEGYWTVAQGDRAHAEGYMNNAAGEASHAEGSFNYAWGDDSHAEGYATIAQGMAQHVQGQFNVEDTEYKYAHIVGGGSDDDNRANIHTLDWEGNAWFAGNIEGKNIDQINNDIVNLSDEVGINLWDEEWEVTSNNRVQSKNYIKIDANKEYFISSKLWNYIMCYDSIYKFIGNATDYTETDDGYYFRVLPNTEYIKFYTVPSYGTTYKNDICINLSNPLINGNYHPFSGLRKDINDVINKTINVVKKSVFDGGFNQLFGINNFAGAANYYNASYNSTNKTYTVSLKNTSVTWARFMFIEKLIDNHKYIIRFNCNDDVNSILQLYIENTSSDVTSISRVLLAKNVFLIHQSSYQNRKYLTGNINGYWANHTEFNSAINVIDLTEWFGTGNEPTTIEEIDRLLGDKYYDYTLSTPSVQQLSNAETDLKILGWAVPKECPVQNYVDADRKFHQRVGRVHLGNLNYRFFGDADGGYFDTESAITSDIIRTKNTNGYCFKYSVVDVVTVSELQNMQLRAGGTAGRIFIVDRSYNTASAFKTAMEGVYLYYELATEIIIPMDGNEAVAKLNGDLTEKMANPKYSTTEFEVIHTGALEANADVNWTASKAGWITMPDVYATSAMSLSNISTIPYFMVYVNGKNIWGTQAFVAPRTRTSTPIIPVKKGDSVKIQVVNAPLENCYVIFFS